MVWSVSPAWEAVDLTLGDRLHLPVRGPRPYRFGSDNCGCSRTNAWQFSTLPRRRLPAFFSKASTVAKTGAMGAASKAASKAAAKAALRPRAIAEKGGKGRV